MIREAVAEDAELLEDFLVFNNGESNRRLARKYINCMFSNDYRRPIFLVAIEEGKIIGAAAYSEELFSDCIWGISWVSVHLEKRNRGLGKSLVEECLESIKKNAGKTVTVILATYSEKIGLYEKMNFQISGYDHEGCFMTKILRV